MRKVILTMQMTLNGIIEAPKDFKESFVYESEEDWKELFSLLENTDTFLLGRVMYPDYEAHWTSVLKNKSGSENDYKFAQIAAATKHLVFSKTLKTVNWPNTTILDGDLEQEIKSLKSAPGKNIIVWGGATLAMSLINLGLVDELRLVITPLLLNGGKSLFAKLTGNHLLKLVKSQSYKEGLTSMHFVKK